jgi:hypothetical protein
LVPFFKKARICYVETYNHPYCISTMFVHEPFGVRAEVEARVGP